MKRFLAVCLLCVALLPGALAAKIVSEPLSDADMRTLAKAVEIVDSGNYARALEIYRQLDEKYPHNYLVQYEYMYLRYRMEDYKTVVKVAKDLVESPDADAQAFQLYGNALDLTGKRGKARKVYRRGLERFPGSGSLWLELGNLNHLEGKYIEALNDYNAGIEASPGFASNYYRGAILYLSSTMPVCGLTYAETAILLAPTDTGRHRDLALLMDDCYRKNITVQLTPEGEKINVTLATTHQIVKAPGNDSIYLPFPTVYEICMLRGAMEMASTGEVFVGSIPQLAKLRRAAVEAYFANGRNLFGNSMYLLEYQKKVIDAGHWDAYNYFLFSATDQADTAAWLADNEEKFRDFAHWYSHNPLTLDKQHTVGFNTILDNTTPLTPAEVGVFLGEIAAKAQ